MNLEIYNMTDYDLSLIKDILIDDFDDFWTYDVLQEELNNPNSEYFVAKLENNILGFAGIWKALDDVHITDIVVKKSNRQTGIGSKLLEKLIQTAKSQNFNSITLEVNEHNLPAINLYLKYGFKNVGFRKKYYNNKDNAIIMTKEL
jgi:ribosomal-protein-alanine acetyltransferase